MNVLEDTEKLFSCSLFHGAHEDNVAVLFVEDKHVFVTSVRGLRESDSGVVCNTLFQIYDIGKYWIVASLY